jgi:hypothetical protein
MERQNYVKECLLNPRHFDLFVEYFDLVQEDNCIYIDKFKLHLETNILKNKRINATQQDFQRIIDITESVRDYALNFHEFIDIMLLFLASEYNLQRRIFIILKANRTQHSTNGYLNEAETNKFFTYLNNFYNTSFSCLIFNKEFNKGTNQMITYSKFAHLAAPIFRPFVFVR